jgi:hypothetical protein
MGVLQIILSETKGTFWSLQSSESSFQLHALCDMNSTGWWKSNKIRKKQDQVGFNKNSTPKGAGTLQSKPNLLMHGYEVTVSLSSLLHMFQDRSRKAIVQQHSEVCTKNITHG